MTIYTSSFNGITLKTGDLICTADGKPDILPGQFWRLIGRLLPGVVDHVIIYIGPRGRCIESGALGVISFSMPGKLWQSEKRVVERGLLIDEFYGVVFPLESAGLSEYEERRVREQVAAYCMAQLGKPYNLNFLDSEREDAFYCSQLAYKAYQPHGINLNTGSSLSGLPGSEKIVFPQEIWAGFPHQH